MTYDRFGNPNSAYSFNNDYIYIGLFNISVPVTVSVWFKSPQTNDQWDTILGWNSDIDPFNGISIQANGDGDIRARIGSEHNDAISTIKTIDGDNYWHNITITKKVSDNTVILYVDGTANISAIANYNIGTWHNLYFGRSFRPVSWDEYFICSIDDVRIYNRVLSASEIQQLYQEGDSQHLNLLYYPHVASGGTWETEICAINTGSENIEGVFRAYTDEGISASDDIAVALGAYERREITVGEEFTDPSSIGYIIFESDSENVVGYTKFYILGKYRAALPAVSQPNSGDFYIPHVASNSAWWTGVGLVNTNSSARQLTFTFNNGMTRAISLAPKEHKSLTIGSLFGGQTPADIESATVTGGDGVVGLELF